MDFNDRGLLSSFFNAGGYVLDFTNSTFDTFTSQSIGIAIKQKYNLSKGASLTKFTEEAEEPLVIKLYKDLFRYYDEHNSIDSQSPECVKLYNKCKCILDNNSNISISTPSIKNIDREYIRELVQRANNDIDNNEFDSAITKVRTVIEEVLIKGLEENHVENYKKGDINNLYKNFSHIYKMETDRDMDRRVKELLSGLNKMIDSIAQMRNSNSDAHGVGSKRISIKKHHARLFVNSGIVMADFLTEVMNNAKE